MLEGLGADRHRLKLQAREQQARQPLVTQAYKRQETDGRHDLARQWYRHQRQLQGVAKGLAQLPGSLSPESGLRNRLVQAESQRMVALGGSFVRAAEAAGRRGLLREAMGDLGLLHAFVRDKQLILQHAAAHADMIAEAPCQAVRAIQVRATSYTWRHEAGRRSHRPRTPCTICCLALLPSAGP